MQPRPWVRSVFGLVFGAALVASCYFFISALRINALQPATYYGAGCLILSFATALVWRSEGTATSSPIDSEPRFSLSRLAVWFPGFVAIGMALAALLLSGIFEFPPGFTGEETRLVLALEAIHDNPSLKWNFAAPPLGYPVSLVSMVYAALQLLGVGPQELRLFTSIIVACSAVPVYVAIRQYGSQFIAACGTTLFLVSPWVIHFARRGGPMVIDMFGAALCCCGIAIVLRPDCFRSSPFRLKTLGGWALMGIGVGIAFNSYMAGKLVVVMAGVTIAWAMLVTPRFGRRHVVGPLLVSFGAGVFLLDPWLFSRSHSPEAISQYIFDRSWALGIQNDICFEQSFEVVLKNLIRHLSFFFVTSDGRPDNFLVGEPLVGELLRPVFLASLLTSAFAPRRVAQFFPFLAFGILVQAGVMSRWHEAEKIHRIFVAAPIVFVSSAVFISNMWRSCRWGLGANSYLRRILPFGMGLALFFLTGIQFISDVVNYSVRYPIDKDTPDALGIRERELVSRMAVLSQSRGVVVDWLLLLDERVQATLWPVRRADVETRILNPADFITRVKTLDSRTLLLSNETYLKYKAQIAKLESGKRNLFRIQHREVQSPRLPGLNWWHEIVLSSPVKPGPITRDPRFHRLS